MEKSRFSAEDGNGSKPAITRGIGMAPGKVKPVTARQHLPRHIAIIMDGNGRWAKQRGLPRIAGHREGMHSVRTVIEHCSHLGLKYLTLYAFSTENWRRPPKEIQFLMGLLLEYFNKEIKALHQQGVRVRIFGRRERLSREVKASLDAAVETTAANRGLGLNLAFNYGGRQEILDAVNALLEARPQLPVTERTFSRYLYFAGIPDPDCIIRTSGESRLSNFLLWQAAYAEIILMPVCWPDFRAPQLDEALAEFTRRQRRFGGVEVRDA
jgi:undecaprenyl diphosphate synthase